MVESPRKCDLRGYVVNTRELGACKCVPVPLSYCCDFPKAKDMSEMRHTDAMKRLRVTCTETGEDMCSAELASGVQ